MNKVYFGNYEYLLIPGGYGMESEAIRFIIFADDIDLAEVEDVITTKANVKKIEIRKEETGALTQVFRGYVTNRTLEKVFDYVYGSKVDEDGDEHELTSDVIIITMAKPSLREQTEKNTADIEYIAIVEDIEL